MGCGSVLGEASKNFAVCAKRVPPCFTSKADMKCGDDARIRLEPKRQPATTNYFNHLYFFKEYLSAFQASEIKRGSIRYNNLAYLYLHLHDV